VSPLSIENPSVGLKIGLLLQPQYQFLGDNTLSGQAVGSPSVKYAPSMSIQDALLTARPRYPAPEKGKS